jgi:hypothetical protein
MDRELGCVAAVIACSLLLCFAAYLAFFLHESGFAWLVILLVIVLAAVCFVGSE